VSSLGGVQNMFYGATSFNAPIGKWKLKSITNMENMFREATAFNQDISSWDVSNITQMKGLFQDATSFNQNIRNWKLNDKLPKSPTIFKDAKAFNIKEYNPFLNKKREVDTSTANLSPEDKKTISKIKKLLIDRDFEKIDLGLELLISLNNLKLFETLLHDCKIGPNFSSLIPNKFFTGSGPAQPYLDYALINIIANAPQEAKIDDSLLLKNIFSPDTGKISFNDISNSELRDFLVRSIDKFTSLTSVDVSLDSSKGHNYEELFANNNITDLTVSGDPSNLKWLNNFSQLKVLIFKVYTVAENLDDYENFKYLENLEELTFHSSRFEHLDFLAECKKLKKLNLSISYNSYLNDVKLENIDFLNKLQQLEELVISGLSSSYVDVGLEALKNCSQIKILTLDIKEEGANQLKFLNKCKSLEVLNLTSYKDFNLFGKISTIQMLSGLKSLKSISVGNLGQYATVENLTGALPFNFFGINDSLMTDLEFKESKSPILKGHKLRVGENQISKVDGYFYHENNVNSSLEKSKLSADDKKVLSEVKKNLLSRDYNLIDDGVKKLSSLNNHLLFENLLDGCSISETRPNYFELNTNKNFTGSGPAQPYLNYALFQVLANLPEETNVVNSLLINQNTYLDTKVFNLNELYSQFISLDKFPFLESLKIDFKIFEIMNEGANPDITRENWFKNSNLKKLDISNFSGSFKFLKNLKDLESLSLEFGFYEYDFIEYFKFLENIKTLNLTNINYSSYNESLKDLDFLKNFKKIKSLNITLNGGYGSSENVESLDVIKNFNALESLVLRGIPTEINLDFLLDCKGLKFLILDFNNNNNETINLECLKNCSLLEKLILNNIGEINIEGKISDINQLNELENLRTLKIKDIIISGINDKVFIK
jgi:surface protein